jgi:hypothetical protein
MRMQKTPNTKRPHRLEFTTRLARGSRERKAGTYGISVPGARLKGYSSALTISSHIFLAVAVEQLNVKPGIARGPRMWTRDQTSLTSKSVSISAGSSWSLLIMSSGSRVPAPPRQKQETSALTPSRDINSRNCFSCSSRSGPAKIRSTRRSRCRSTSALSTTLSVAKTQTPVRPVTWPVRGPAR